MEDLDYMDAEEEKATRRLYGIDEKLYKESDLRLLKKALIELQQEFCEEVEKRGQANITEYYKAFLNLLNELLGEDYE